MKKIIEILHDCKNRPNLDELNKILLLRDAVEGAKPSSSRVFDNAEILNRFLEFKKLRDAKMRPRAQL